MPPSSRHQPASRQPYSRFQVRSISSEGSDLLSLRTPARSRDSKGSVLGSEIWARAIAPLPSAGPCARADRTDPSWRPRHAPPSSAQWPGNLGPSQAARHLRGLVTAHELSAIARRHVTVESRR
jgi:hypothetical protein